MTDRHNHRTGQDPTEPVMSTRELLEAAALDAVGLLDEGEAAAFDAAFRRADPDIRDTIIEEQARLAVSDAFFADVDAPDHLRERVLAAVYDAIAARRAGRGSDTPATATTAVAEAPKPAAVRHAAGHRLPVMARPRRVHAAWRAATIGLSVAVVALGAVQFQLQGDYRAFRSEAGVARLIEAIGVEHIRDTLLDPSTLRSAFVADASSAAEAQAAVWMHPEWDVARLYCYRLPQSPAATYRVVELDDAGNEVRTLQTFRSAGLLDDVSVPLDARPRTVRLAIVMDADGSSTRLMSTTLRIA